AWSFLWSISVKEYAWYTGDRAFVESIYPAVVLNLRRALARVDATGLFRGSGMLDWTPIDSGRPYVTHNQMFLCEALRTAADVAGWLGHAADALAWRKARESLAATLHRRLWVTGRDAYADSMDPDGSISPRSCRHTSALGLLYDLIPDDCREAAIRNLMTPPEGMTDVGSPFALQFIMEAMVHTGRPDAALTLIRGDWSMMLKHGATTFWEMIHDDWRKGLRRDPTRSHCHAWSCAPLDFIGRVLLGIRPLKPGFEEVEINPSPCGLDFAEGEALTPHGRIRVRWARDGAGDLKMHVDAPEGIKVHAGPLVEPEAWTTSRLSEKPDAP
ncbi:MAG: alpha-L-rhamnosidase C-terminal domain-containing protein, partial [Kiritimatiellia bacterium]